MSIGGYIKNKQPLVYRTFSNALESGKLAHAYLLLGEAGTPLKEAAMYLAKSVLCDYPNPLAASSSTEGSRICVISKKRPTHRAIRDGLVTIFLSLRLWPPVSME